MSAYGRRIEEAAIERIRLLASAEEMPSCPQDLLEQGFCDPIRVFVKGEPHSIAKAKEGRFRLIFSVSVVDQMVERYFAQIQGKREVSQWQSLPSLIGIGFDQRHIKAMRNSKTWFHEDEEIIESDISGWDWTVQECELRAEAEMRVRLIEECPPTLARLIHNRMHCILKKVMVFSDGTAAIGPIGVQPSGSYLTSSGNSRMRAMLSLRARYDLGFTTDELRTTVVKCVGDDSLESSDCDAASLKRKFEQYGHLVKAMKISNQDDFEFCSHQFVGGELRYLNMAKSMYHWAQKARGPDQNAAMLGLSAMCDRRVMEAVHNIVSSYGVREENDKTKEAKQVQCDFPYDTGNEQRIGNSPGFLC